MQILRNLSGLAAVTVGAGLRPIGESDCAFRSSAAAGVFDAWAPNIVTIAPIATSKPAIFYLFSAPLPVDQMGDIAEKGLAPLATWVVDVSEVSRIFGDIVLLGDPKFALPQPPTNR